MTSMTSMTVIGLGKMGSALIQGVLATEIFEVDKIIGCDVEAKEMKFDCRMIKTITDNKKGVELAEIVLLAVKPQIIHQVLQEIKSVIAGKLVVSVAAGVTIDYLESELPSSCRIVRAMPNIPILVNAGISAITPGKRATKEDVEIVKNILGGVGETIVVKEELMNAVTGLSGSGPAYISLMIEALADGGVLTGLSRELSLRLAAQTMIGTAKMIIETGIHPGELKDMVASPGGTTIKGIEVLEQHGLRGILIEAVKKATEQAKELNADTDDSK